MPNILLTGAGFTRNWGGWLAKELEGDLLGRVHGNERLRMLLQNSDSFEEALLSLQQEAKRADGQSSAHLTQLRQAIAESFQAMNLALADRGGLEFSQDRRLSVMSFLAKFDVIFTLNQDLLLELFYDPHLETPRRWNGRYWPGIVGRPADGLDSIEKVSGKRRVSDVGGPQPNLQPIYKLHGSVDWQDASGDLFVVGGGKESYIQSKPLLVQYFREFQTRLSEPKCRLMIAGYGFADEHVNRLLVAATEANPTLGVFHVHPEGRDAVHRGARERVQIYAPPLLTSLRCFGESRRPLSSTFGGDELEHAKLLRFFG